MIEDRLERDKLNVAQDNMNRTFQLNLIDQASGALQKLSDAYRNFATPTESTKTVEDKYWVEDLNLTPEGTKVTSPEEKSKFAINQRTGAKSYLGPVRSRVPREPETAGKPPSLVLVENLLAQEFLEAAKFQLENKFGYNNSEKILGMLRDALGQNISADAVFNALPTNLKQQWNESRKRIESGLSKKMLPAELAQLRDRFGTPIIGNVKTPLLDIPGIYEQKKDEGAMW